MIHESAGQEVATLVLQLEVLQAVLDSDLEQARYLAAEAHATAERCASGLRRSIADLTPVAPAGGFIGTEIERLVTEKTMGSGQEIAFIAEGSPGPLDEQQAFVALAFVREGLTNVRKHAPGAAARVCLRSMDDHMEVTVVDTGRAVADDSVFDRPGHGLALIRAHARTAGGDVTWRTDPSAGTCLALQLPFKET
jgi:signal transduction histidine kinase